MCILKRNLYGSASEQNIQYTYVCLVNNLPNNLQNSALDQEEIENFPSNTSDEEVDKDQSTIKVERSIALHNLELSDNTIKKKSKTPSNLQFDQSKDASEAITEETDNFISYDNPNVLKLTRMKWLTDGNDECPDASSPSISPSISSTCSVESVLNVQQQNYSTSDRHLRTILDLDREQNMFGLSDIVVVSEPPRAVKKDKRPIFHQTAIVQICTTKCLKSRTDLAPSLKCGICSCRTCRSMASSCISTCGSCATSCCLDPCKPPRRSTPRRRGACVPCRASKCVTTVQEQTCRVPKCITPACVTDGFGLKITVKPKPKIESFDSQLTPRASCILSLPAAVRSCHHVPRCSPPTSQFPYLMPCYWPARSSAPCTDPARCFHNPPCLPVRSRTTPRDPNTSCPKRGLCSDKRSKPTTTCPNKQGVAEGTGCPNPQCPGKIPHMKEAIEKLYGPNAKPSTASTPPKKVK